MDGRNSGKWFPKTSKVIVYGIVILTCNISLCHSIIGFKYICPGIVLVRHPGTRNFPADASKQTLWFFVGIIVTGSVFDGGSGIHKNLGSLQNIMIVR